VGERSVRPQLAATGDRHEWDQPSRAWHLAYAVLALMAAGLCLGAPGLTPAHRYAGLAVLAVACAWYAVLGRRVLHAGPSRAGLVYIAVAIPLTVGLFAVAAPGGLLLCLLYPHIWSLLPVRPAIVATAVAAAATGAATLAGSGLTAPQLVVAAAVAAGSLLVATVIGLWIHRIIGQSCRRATVIAELAATQAELAELGRRAGVMAERERLACDIHDTLAQGFASILLLLEAVEVELGPGGATARRHLRAARQTAQENLAEARAMVAALSPPHLRNASLPAALRQLVDRVAPDLGAASALDVTGTPRPLAASQEVVLLRAAQEALANVRKHAAAGHVAVRQDYPPGAVSLEVADDGAGFDPAAPAAGFGLAGMRARAVQAGGTLAVRAAPGQGATVRVTLPAPRDGEQDTGHDSDHDGDRDRVPEAAR
jgi:signal transduction histidine kinase